jgi:hypothetical protein
MELSDSQLNVLLLSLFLAALALIISIVNDHNKPKPLL